MAHIMVFFAQCFVWDSVFSIPARRMKKSRYMYDIVNFCMQTLVNILMRREDLPIGGKEYMKP